eukprot:maker-scaffold149_size310270-snap-gene-0.8 protein:Tk01264 transcript:maker-scaffold149_size310270-snap-gene-0.8-mRNA-1 annotation:"unnamed protein product"
MDFKAYLVLCLCVTLAWGQVPKNLCHVPGCRCDPNGERPDLIDVVCQCETKLGTWAPRILARDTLIRDISAHDTPALDTWVVGILARETWAPDIFVVEGTWAPRILARDTLIRDISAHDTPALDTWVVGILARETWAPDIFVVEELLIGVGTLTEGVSEPPQNAIQLKISSCHSVELFPRIINHMPNIQNITIEKASKVNVHPRLYNPKAATGQTARLGTIEFSEVQDLSVGRHAFEGISIDGSFWLKEVTMERVPSMAFNFDHVKEFSIFGSRFDRVSMWGFKLESCSEFNALGMTRFYSLASRGLFLQCEKFILAYNVFVSVHDSSFDVKFGFADIQGNTFDSMIGHPFMELRPMTRQELKPESKSGLIFRENKFTANPFLPFGSLAMPAFEKLDPEIGYVDVDKNHFVCECNKLSWFIAAMTHQFDKEAIAEIGSNQLGYGSLEFIDLLYETSGHCLNCQLTNCEVSEKDFMKYAYHALIVDGDDLKCSISDQPLKSHSKSGKSTFVVPDRPSSYSYEREHEDDETLGGRRPPSNLQDTNKRVAEISNSSPKLKLMSPNVLLVALFLSRMALA